MLSNDILSLERCSDPIEKVAAILQPDNAADTSEAPNEIVSNATETGIDVEGGTALRFDLLDDTWNMLWDDLEVPGLFNY